MKNFIYSLLFFTSTLAWSQWTNDYNVNTLVSTNPTDDIQSIGTPDGRTYVILWDTSSGYKLKVQLLNQDGTRAFGEEGMLANDIANNSTYTVTRSEAVDANNNLYIAFTATGDGNGYVNKISPSGQQLFGANGIVLPNAYDLKVAPTSDGGAYVGWYEGNTGKLMRYNSSGVAQWGTPITINSPSSAPITTVGELSVMADNSVIVFIHTKTLSWSPNSILWAQRYSSTGTTMWANPVQVSTQTLMANRRYSLVKDNDITYLGYYGSTGSRFDSFIQKIESDGNLPWGADGVDMRIDGSTFEMTTNIAMDGDYLWAALQVCNSTQSQYGQFVQKINKNTGERYFTDLAKQIFPISSANKIQVGDLQITASRPLFLFASDISNGVNPIQLGVVLLNENGDFAWENETMMIATTTNNKSRYGFTKNVNGQSVAVWTENRSGSKAFAQNIMLEAEDADEGCFNTGAFDQWPSGTFTPGCIGMPETITSGGWAGEFSKVVVTAGTEYVFSSSVPTDFITIAPENQDIAYITGTGSVTWTATSNEAIRFYTHLDTDCNIQEVSRSRIVQCGEILPPPANDNCDGAIAIACGETVTGTTVFATNSGGNTAGDVFYKYTATGESQLITVSLCGSSYDTYLRIFTDCSLNNEITYNDDACGLQSEVSFVSDGTSTYYIMVEGFGANTGSYTLNVTCSEPPAFTCEENFVASNGFENGLFFGGADNQRMAVDIIVGESGFTVYGAKLNVFVDGNTDLDFSVKFYEDSFGYPGDEIHSTTATVHESSYAGNAFSYDIYNYVLDFEENVVLDANSTYWMEIESNGFAWESSSGTFLGNGLAFNNASTGGSWATDSFEDLVFELVCEDLKLTDLNSFDFSYYPNPVKDVLNISSKNPIHKVSVYNLAGQEVLLNSKIQNGQINMSALTTGTYVFRVVLENGQVETFKIVKN